MKVKIGQTCPSCKEGTIVERKGKFGIFYGCSSYYRGCYFVSREIDPSVQEINDQMVDSWAKQHNATLDPVI